MTTWFCGDQTTLNYIKAYNYSHEINTSIEISKFPQQNYVVINNKTGRDLKILQLTDIHLGCGYLSINLDKKVVNEVFKCVDTVDPDIIVVTGDAISPIYVTSGTRNSYLQLEALILLLEKLGRPYTFCFGNHDADGLASKDYISEKLQNAPNSFFLKGASNIDGQGNYFVKILNNGVLSSSMILLDSGDRARDFNYAGVSKNQVEWYETTIKSLKEEKSDIKNLLFFHIPIPEYQTFFDNYVNKNENYELLMGEKSEKVACGKQNGLYEKIKELDSTKWVFCGHDHTNNFSIIEKSTNITLSYGMSMDFSAYPILKYKSRQRGARVIKIASDGSVQQKLTPQIKNYQEVDFI
ncbi:MAG: metallophosphoesterase [Christensenellales bacterium]